MSKNLIIPSVFTAIDKFSGPTRKMANNGNTAFARMQRNMRKAGETAFGVAKKSAMVGAAIIAPMALLANEAMDFEASMSNVATLIDTNVESIEQMGNKVLELSTKLPVPIEELTASLYDVRSAGFDASEAMSVLEGAGKLSVAGLSSVEEATNISTSALNAFASEGLTAAETNNILFKTVKAGKTTVSELAQSFGSATQLMSGAGVKLADFSAATAALTSTGVPASVAQTQLRASISKLLKPSAEMEKIFKGLGVTTGKELLSNYDNLGEAFSAISSTSDKLGVNLAKAWGSTEAMGASTALTTTLSEKYSKTLDDMGNGVDDLTKAYDKQSKTGKASMQMMKNNVQSLAITLGQALLPIISDLVSSVTPIIKKFGRWARQNKGTVKTIIKVVLAIGRLAIGISVFSFAIGIAQKAFAMFNVTMAANPIGLVITGVIALGLALNGIVNSLDKTTTAQRLNNEVTERALDNTIDQRVEVAMLFKTLRKAEEGSKAYTDTLARLDQLQPGITENFNLQEKAINRINEAEKELINTILKRAEVQARAELFGETVKERVSLESQVEASQGQSAMSEFWQGFYDYDNTKTRLEERLVETKAKEGILEAQVTKDETDKVEAQNPEKIKQDAQNKTISENIQKSKMELILPPGFGARQIEGSGGSNFAMPNLATTRQ
tara:strand:+ start:2799 stop:4811 length:2013 start_codon:yes stop_codon:yes gene_type:complete